jgi:hypothetical protein
MFDLTVLRSRTGVITSLILAGVAACSAEDTGNPFTGLTTASSTVASGTGGAPTTSAATTVGSTVATTGATTTGAGGGATTGAGGAAGMTGTGGSGGSGGAKDAGDGGVAKDGGLVVDAGTCTPGPIPAPNAMYPRVGWGGQWNPTCDFMSKTLGDCTTLLPKYAFDGLGATRTSIGNTHIMAGGATAQMIGDSFTFDMTTCHRVGRIVMFAAAPPNNQGTFDARDFPGAVDVTVSSDCTTSALGAITGTFGPVVAMGTEPQPGCMGTACNMPMTITFAQPVPAKCVRLTLTRILQLGGGIWWAIDELQVFP